MTEEGIVSAAEAAQEPGGLREAARRNGQRALADQEAARRVADRQNVWHHVFGIGGVIAGAIAGAAAIAEAAPAVTASAAIVATVLTGIQTFIKPLEKAHTHWSRGAGLGALAQQWDVLVNQTEEPTRQQFTELIAEYRRLHEPRTS